MSRIYSSMTLVLALAMVHVLDAPQAAAQARDVGLGVAAGLQYSPTALGQGTLVQTPGQSFAWGFFVDIPLVDTFYISPATILYELDLGTGKKPVTDIDLNFKFIIPLSILRLGVGGTVGLSNMESMYRTHVGFLGYAALNLLSNVDVFVMLQYKRLFRDTVSINDLHGFLGGMFHF